MFSRRTTFANNYYRYATSQHKIGVNIEDPIMHSVFPEGMHSGTEKQIWFIPFEALCVSSMDVRKALVKLTNDAREALIVPKAVS